jgi:hypothetical protein
MDLRRNQTKLNENIEKAKMWWARIKGSQPNKTRETFDPHAFRSGTHDSPGDSRAPPAQSPGEDRW